MDGDVVKKITITATGENVDSTRDSVEKLSAATTQLSKATSDFSANHESYTDKLLKAATVFGLLAGGAVVAGKAYSTLSDIMSDSARTMEKNAEAQARVIASLLPDKIRAYTVSWEDTNKLLESYIVLAGKAAAVDVSTDFFQRETKAAVLLKGSVDDVVKSLETLRSATKEQLGGSTGQQRVDELVSFGNFKGNTGVGQLSQATTQEDKYRAVVSLIDQALAKGERLAGLDVAKTFLGQAVADNLAKDSDYLDRMQTAAAKLVTAKDIIPEADVSRALDLQNRLEAAEAIISKKWISSQQLLNPLVLFFKEIWVDIVEAVASAFTTVEKLVNKMLSIPADLWQRFQDWRHAGEAEGPQPETPEQALARAQQTLRTGMQNPNTVRLSTEQANTASNQLRRDTSHSKADDQPDSAAYDRATEAILKYIEVTKAASGAVDLTVGEQEKLKVVAQLTAAAMKDGTPITAELAKEMDALGKRAGDAAAALAKARIESNIKFGQNTALLSPDDVAIARELKSIYPDVATALSSVEASALRTNNALSGISSQLTGTLTSGLTDIFDGTKQVGQGFSDMSKLIVRAIEEMIVKLLIVGPLMRALQGAFSGGISVSGFNPIAGISGHADGTDSSPGGWHMVGENGPELMNVPKGAKVLPHGVSPSDGGSNVQVNVINNASGTKVETRKSNEGGIDIHDIIISAVDQHTASGGLDQIMRNRYGTPLRTRSR